MLPTPPPLPTAAHSACSGTPGRPLSVLVAHRMRAEFAAVEREMRRIGVSCILGTRWVGGRAAVQRCGRGPGGLEPVPGWRSALCLSTPPVTPETQPSLTRKPHRGIPLLPSWWGYREEALATAAAHGADPDWFNFGSSDEEEAGSRG